MIWWGKSKDKKKEKDQDGVARVRTEPSPDAPKEQVPREKLPQTLQKLVDREDDYYDELYAP
jgi:fission process protein 1